MGKPPVPLEVRRRQGGTSDRNGAVSHRPVPEPVRTSETPPDPDVLVEEALPGIVPEEGRVFARGVMRELDAAGILDRVDRAAVVACSVSWARFCRAAEAVNREGMVALGSGGQIVESPMLAIERHERLQVLRWMEQFGLTPSARARLGLAALQGRSLQQELNETLGEKRR